MRGQQEYGHWNRNLTELEKRTEEEGKWDAHLSGLADTEMYNKVTSNRFLVRTTDNVTSSNK